MATQGDLSSSIVVSILVKSTCRRSRAVVATIGHKGALGVLPSYWRQCLQASITCLICLAIPGHQKCSCNRERAWSWPWCPASQWHPFRAAVQCALGTMNNKQILILPFGSGAKIEDTSEESEVLVIPPHHLSLLAHYTLPEKCPQISFLPRPQPLQNCIQLRILFLSSCPIGDMHFY